MLHSLAAPEELDGIKGGVDPLNMGSLLQFNEELADSEAGDDIGLFQMPCTEGYRRHGFGQEIAPQRF